MPSYRPSTLPPRLLSRARRALVPSLLFGGGLMLLLPLAQIIDAATDREERKIEVVSTPPPPLLEPPAPPPEPEPEKTPIDELKEEPKMPDPFMLVVDPDFSGVNQYVDTRLLGDFDQDAWDDDIEDWANLTVAPQVLAQIDPRYPPELKSADIEGDVRVKFLIRADGSVSRITVLKSSDSRFSDSAMRAVRRWRFQPGEKSGRAVAVWALQNIPFRIH